MKSTILVAAAALVAIPALMSAPKASATASPEIAAAKQCMDGYVWDERTKRCRKVRRGSY